MLLLLLALVVSPVLAEAQTPPSKIFWGVSTGFGLNPQIDYNPCPGGFGHIPANSEYGYHIAIDVGRQVTQNVLFRTEASAFHSPINNSSGACLDFTIGTNSSKPMALNVYGLSSGVELYPLHDQSGFFFSALVGARWVSADPTASRNLYPAVGIGGGVAVPFTNTPGPLRLMIDMHYERVLGNQQTGWLLPVGFGIRF